MKGILLALTLIVSTATHAGYDPLKEDPAITAAVEKNAQLLNLPNDLSTINLLTSQARMDLTMRRFKSESYGPIIREMLRMAEQFEDARQVVPDAQWTRQKFERADQWAFRTFDPTYTTLGTDRPETISATLRDIKQRLASTNPEVRKQGETLAQASLELPNRWFQPYLNTLRDAPRQAMLDLQTEERRQLREEVSQKRALQKAEQQQALQESNKATDWGDSLAKHGFFGTLWNIAEGMFILAVLGLLIGAYITQKFMIKGRMIPLKFVAAGAAAGLAGGLVTLIGLDPIKNWVAGGAALAAWVFVGFQVRPAKDTSHGSAEWASADAAYQLNRLHKPVTRPFDPDQAFALGKMPGSPKDFDPRFRYMGHVLTCAPTGAGKGIGAVIPNLLEYPGSALVLDIKGENYAVTARQRREIGHEVYLLDPFHVCGTEESHAFNWLDRLDPESPDIVSESAALADMLIVPDPKGDSHWDDSAKDLLRGLMIYVAGMPKAHRHIGTVREILTSPENELQEHLETMQRHKEYAHSLPYRAANAFLSKADKERSGVLSSAIRHTGFLDDPRIVESLNRSDFDLADLKTKSMTVYIAMPPAKLAAYNRYMRCFIGQALTGITSTQATPHFKVAFFLDEFAQLGRMAAIEDSISLVRGYGAAFWIYVQDLSQLKGVYPKWQTFLSNAAKQFYGTADYDTARYISDSLGQQTIEFTTTGSSQQGGFQTGSSMSDSTHRQGRSLLNPDEVMRLGPTTPIVLINGEPPYILQRLNYLSDLEYAGRFDKNPFH